MKHKRLIANILIMCLILLCAAIVFISWLSISRISNESIHIKLFNFGQFSAETDQEWSFDQDGPMRLVVDSTAGKIDVSASNGNEIKITAHKTAWEITTKRAESALANMPIEVKQEGNQVIIRYKPPSTGLVIGAAQYDTADFTVIVPEECELSAATSVGGITVVGTIGDVNLHSDYGNLAASDMRGSLHADTNSGNIHAQRIDAGQKPVYLETDFGAIEIEQTSAYSIEVHTNSGKVYLNDIETSGKVELQSDFGDIQMLDSSSDALAIDTNGGKITVDGVELKDTLAASSDVGDINVQKVNTSGYDLSTQSGNISIQNGAGSIKASTDFGKIVISGAKNADLDLHANSGAIEFSGSLGNGPHTLRTDFGDIHLILPEDACLTLDLKTEFGKLKSVFPITISGDIASNTWKGNINGGGANLQAHTNNGNITLDVLIE